MEIRLNPYNSPFIPYWEEGVYWLGKEHQHGFHDSHVREFRESRSWDSEKYLASRSAHLRSLSIANTQQSMSDSEYNELYDLYANFGIQAAGKRLGFL